MEEDLKIKRALDYYTDKQKRIMSQIDTHVRAHADDIDPLDISYLSRKVEEYNLNNIKISTLRLIYLDPLD